jgi:hypothetical protein
MTKLAMILGLALAISAPAFADDMAAPATTEAPAASAPAAPMAKTGKMHGKHKRGGKKAKKGASDAPKAE